MTENEWRQSIDIGQMILCAEARCSPRTLRLFAHACCQRIKHVLGDHRSVHALAFVERYADGACNTAELEFHFLRAREAANEIDAQLPYRDGVRCINTHSCAASAVWCAANLDLKRTFQMGGSSSPVISVAFWASSAVSLSPEGARSQGKFEAATRTEALVQCELAREIFGNPFRTITILPAWLKWNDATVVKLAQRIYDDRDFDCLPILGDALEEAGCTDTELLTHCRDFGPHVRGCWVVDLLLSRS